MSQREVCQKIKSKKVHLLYLFHHLLDRRNQMICNACLKKGYKKLYMVLVLDETQLFCKECYVYEIGTDPELRGE